MKTLKGTWQFNEVLTDYSNVDQAVNYTCGAYSIRFQVYVRATCSRLYCSDDGELCCYVESTVPDLTSYGDNRYPASVIVYVADGWNTTYFEIDNPCIYFGDDPQEVSDDFYEWLTTNAKPVMASIHYNGAAIASLLGGATATLKCAGMKMESDVVVQVAEQTVDAGSGDGGSSELIPACQVRVEPVEIEDPRYYHSEPFQPLPAEISEYPYALILQKNDGIVRLWLTDNKCYLKTESDGKQKLCVPANNIYFTHSATWCPRGAYMNTWNYGVNGSDVWNIWWSNFDIPRESSEGTDICWYATEPQIQQPADATHFYYNGVLLPKIPEDMLATHPYCVMAHKLATEQYSILLSTGVWYSDGTRVDDGLSEESLYLYTYAGDETWREGTAGNYIFSHDSHPLVWSNHDVPKGSVDATDIYLYATQPVPEA